VAGAGAQEGTGYHLVAGLVGMFVGPTRRCRTFPGPLADGGDVARQPAEPAQGHLWGEIGGVEGAEHVGDPDAVLLIDTGQHGVVAGSGQLAEPRERPAGRALAPLRE